MVADQEIALKRCNICGNHKPKSLRFFYANAGNPGGLSKCCKECADAAKKRYKERYRRRPENKVGVRQDPPKARKVETLPGRTQYALLTHKCPRCGGPLQRHRDQWEKDAGCMSCMMCSREVWLPSRKVEREFRANPPQAVPMPFWVAQTRGVKRKRKAKAKTKVGRLSTSPTGSLVRKR